MGRSEESAKEMVKGEEYKGKKKMVAYKRGKKRKKQTGDFKRNQKDQIRKGRLKKVMNEEKKRGKRVSRQRSEMTTLEKQ